MSWKSPTLSSKKVVKLSYPIFIYYKDIVLGVPPEPHFEIERNPDVRLSFVEATRGALSHTIPEWNGGHQMAQLLRQGKRILNGHFSPLQRRLVRYETQELLVQDNFLAHPNHACSHFPHDFWSSYGYLIHCQSEDSVSY